MLSSCAPRDKGLRTQYQTKAAEFAEIRTVAQVRTSTLDAKAGVGVSSIEKRAGTHRENRLIADSTKKRLQISRCRWSRQALSCSVTRLQTAGQEGLLAHSQSGYRLRASADAGTAATPAMRAGVSGTRSPGCPGSARVGPSASFMPMEDRCRSAHLQRNVAQTGSERRSVKKSASASTLAGRARAEGVTK